MIWICNFSPQRVAKNNAHEREHWYGRFALAKENKIKADLPERLGPGP